MNTTTATYTSTIETGVYQTSIIGRQVWMSENLDTAFFRNGDPVTHAMSSQKWIEAGWNRVPAWCFYNNNPENDGKYGKLYNWWAINDPRGLAPLGFHVACDDEWEELALSICRENKGSKNGIMDWDDVGKYLKARHGWEEKGNGTDEYGFSALPGGSRTGLGHFVEMGYHANFWTSTEYNTLTPGARTRELNSCYSSFNRYHFGKGYGFSVRCVKDRI